MIHSIYKDYKYTRFVLGFLKQVVGTKMSSCEQDENLKFKLKLIENF